LIKGVIGGVPVAFTKWDIQEALSQEVRIGSIESYLRRIVPKGKLMIMGKTRPPNKSNIYIRTKLREALE
jgi:hypothetical protein